MLGFTVAKHLEQLSVPFFFFWNDSLLWDFSFGRRRNGAKKIIIINFKSTDTVPCIKLK